LKRRVPSDAHHDPRRRLEHRELLSKLLAELDEEDVQIVFYRHHDGMTQEEIAEVLGVTSRTVRNRLDRLDDRVKAYLVRLGEVAE
jgi:RNA polymerase sigma factor (sigma-70 family)